LKLRLWWGEQRAARALRELRMAGLLEGESETETETNAHPPMLPVTAASVVDVVAVVESKNREQNGQGVQNANRDAAAIAGAIAGADAGSDAVRVCFLASIKMWRIHADCASKVWRCFPCCGVTGASVVGVVAVVESKNREQNGKGVQNANWETLGETSGNAVWETPETSGEMDQDTADVRAAGQALRDGACAASLRGLQRHFHWGQARAATVAVGRPACSARFTGVSDECTRRAPRTRCTCCRCCRCCRVRKSREKWTRTSKQKSRPGCGYTCGYTRVYTCEYTIGIGAPSFYARYGKRGYDCGGASGVHRALCGSCGWQAC